MKAKAQLHTILGQQLPHYLTNVVWLFQDAYAQFPARIRTVLLLDGIGLVAAAVWIGGLLLYARALETASMPAWAVDYLSVTPGIGEVSLVVLILTVFGSISGLCLYRAQWRAAYICIDYQKSSIERTMDLVADPTYFGWQQIFPQSAQAVILRFTGVSAQLASLALRRMLRGLLPAAIFLVALAALIWAGPWLTLLLLPLAVLYLVPLYLANRSAARVYVRGLQLIPQTRGQLVERVKQVLAGRSHETALQQARRVRWVGAFRRIAVGDFQASTRRKRDAIYQQHVRGDLLARFVLVLRGAHGQSLG